MKKLIFGIISGALVVSTLASCGEKLLSDAEVKAKIDEGVNAQSAAILSAADAECNAQFESRVQAEVARLQAEAAAAVPATSK